jgi:pyruvate kinase
MSVAAHKSLLPGTFDELIRQVESLHQLIEQRTRSGQELLAGLENNQYKSAENLLHYLALRSQDLRPLQDSLACLGLSSLGRAEPHVLASVNTVLHNLYLLSGKGPCATNLTDVYSAYNEGADRLEYNTRTLLGDYPENRRVHIMVTMSAVAANDYMVMHHLLESGMNCMRINCAHDDASIWSGMIKNLRYAERATGKSCRILMDLDGPKLRTGPMELVPPVLKVKPLRAPNGRVLRSARIWLSFEGSQGREKPAADANLMVQQVWLEHLSVGDRIRFQDVRGSNRSWRIREVTSDGCWAEARKTAYIANGTVLNQVDNDKGGKVWHTIIEGLPTRESVVRLRIGDSLHVSVGNEAGKDAVLDDNGDLLNPGRVSLDIPEIYRDARPGEKVYFDDGRIAGIIEKVDVGMMHIRITNTCKPEERLESDRGVNFPETSLDLPALDEKDLQDLRFVARHADMIGLSFANSPDDVRILREHLKQMGYEDKAVVLKIETKRGFSNLPAMLIEAMRFSACGVMIARGDLAVQCGFERMAELQEEILWVCEAAHVPVIWATQVLEGLTKRGHVSRAEITDAAMGQSAECVMLNKGPHIIDAVQTLDDILQRMQGHHNKKRSMLRKLQLQPPV